MSKQRLVASWRLLGKRPFGHPKYDFGQGRITRIRTAQMQIFVRGLEKTQEYPHHMEPE